MQRGISRWSIALALLCLALAGCEAQGRLEVILRDGAAGPVTPARVELRGPDGEAVIPDEALPIFADCGRLPLHNWVPWTAQLQRLWGEETEVWNPSTGSRQFYTTGTFSQALSPGRYRLAVTKGLEYRTQATEVDLRDGETSKLELELQRWVNLPSAGWYGSDDHLHIPRPHPRFDPLIGAWMAAEGLHVANLLQMGLAQDLHITPQHAFGPAGAWVESDTMVVSGQENPRTHVLGHSIVLGADEWIDFPDAYLLYDRVWRRAHAQGAVNGYAHWGLAGAEEGLALWGHEGLLDFLEVLGFGFPHYRRWYEALNLGLRFTPTAGTDYPCSESLPGRERFYARLEGPLDHAAWLEAVRAGRTFVTNGPVLELRVEEAGIGGEVVLAAPAPVRIEGRVRFDPERDRVTALELVQESEVIEWVEPTAESGELRLEASIEVERSTWFALRARGDKVGETEAGRRRRPSAAHTAAVWVTVDGTPPLGQQPQASRILEAWLTRLDELEARFGEERLAEMAGFPGRGDGISEKDLRANRAALLEAITAARERYAAAGER
jgi:hypothetical protein